jgi:hypothetical protein
MELVAKVSYLWSLCFVVREDKTMVAKKVKAISIEPADAATLIRLSLLHAR